MFRRFNELQNEDLQCETHVHSTWTDGSAPPCEILERAEELSLKKLYFTDHIRSASTYYEAYFDGIAKIADSSTLDVVAGFESKIADYNGNLDISKDAESKAGILIGTVHSVPTDDKFVHPREIDQKRLERAEYELSMAMLESGSADVLGHAGGMSITYFGSFDMAKLEAIIAKCAETEIAFEINSRYHIGILDWLLDKLSTYNPFVSFGSDAHSLDEVGRCSTLMQKRLLS